METRSNVLIVDDNIQFRQIIATLLQEETYHLFYASDGPAALAQADAILPDLILLDVVMPGMDGYSVCRQLRANPRTADIPVIMVTSLDDPEARVQGFHAGVDDFISKPFDALELRARVRTITRLESQKLTQEWLRAHRAAEERATRFRSMVEMGRDLVSEPRLEPLLARALHHATLFSGYDGGSIILPTPEGSLQVWASQGAQAVPPGTLIDQPEKSVSGQVMREQRPLVLEGHGEDAGTHWRSYTKFVPSTICLPLIDTSGRSIGALALNSTSHRQQLGPDDIDALQLLASQLTVMIERSRLHEQNLHLLEQLANREQRLQDLVEKLLVSQEEERRLIAYELHDGLAQVASSAYQHLQTFASGYRPRSDERRQQLEQALDLARRVVQEARQVIGGLRPTVLDDFGLVSALRLEVDQLRQQGWEMSIEAEPAEQRLPATLETTLFRVAQEALTNIRKHASTTRAHLALQHTPDSVRLDVQDWGCGFEVLSSGGPASTGTQMGLLGMQERIALLGGQCTIQSQPGAGTRITVQVPLSGQQTKPEEQTYDTTEPARPDEPTGLVHHAACAPDYRG